MARRLTKRDVDALVIPDGKSEALAFCGELTGFGARRTAGGVSFVYQYREGKGREARKRRVVIGRYGTLTLEQAREIARAMAFDVASGTTPEKRKKAQARDRMTVNELITLWLAEAAHLNSRSGAIRKPQNVAYDAGRLKAHVAPLIGKKRLCDLDRADIERLRDKVQSGATAKEVPSEKPRGVIKVTGGPQAAKRLLQTLSTMFNFAIGRGLMDHNPCRGVRTAPIRRRMRTLSTAELAALNNGLNRALVEGINPMAIAQVRMLLATGARKSEVAAMRWSEVDLERRVWTLHDTKTGLSVRPLTDLAVAILTGWEGQWGRHSSGYVFTRGDGQGFYSGLSKQWLRIRALAGLPDDVTLHTIRHTFATLGAAAHLPTAMLKTALGHASENTTLRYQHLATADAQQAASQIAERIAKAMDGPHAVASVHTIPSPSR